MKASSDEQKKFDNLLDIIQDEPKKKKRLALHGALLAFNTQTHDGTMRKIICAAIRYIGLYPVWRQITALPDTAERNEIILHLCFILWWQIGPNDYPLSDYVLFSASRTVSSSEQTTAAQLISLLNMKPKIAKSIVGRAITLAATEEPKSVSLLLELAKLPQLKRRTRISLAGAILGMDSATTHDLMSVVCDFPELRRDAAAIVLTRPTVTRKDLDLLLSYDATKDMVEIMRCLTD
ncbi:MAG: hypothetical protein V1738_06400 [Patescibacteria group bacterium]